MCDWGGGPYEMANYYRPPEARRPEPTLEDCPLCEGESAVLKNASVFSSGQIDIVPCPRCDGTGKVQRR